MAARLRAFDWRGHALGEPTAWPVELRVAISLCMHSSLPTAIYWGPQLRLIYNDSWAPIPAERHPWAIGRPGKEVWSDIWNVVGPQFEGVVRMGRGFSTFRQRLPMRRNGEVIESYWDYSFTPIFGAEGEVLGVMNQGREVTDEVLATEDQRFFLEIGDRLRDLAIESADASKILKSVMEPLVAHLGLSRAGYAVIEPGEEFCTALGDWSIPGEISLAGGRYRLPDFGEDVHRAVRAGLMVSVGSISPDDGRHSAKAAESFAEIGVKSYLLAPVVRDGRATAVVYLHDNRLRQWTSRQAEFAREIAGRVWLALRNADASVRLNASERRFAAIFDKAAVGLSESDSAGRFIRFNPTMGRLLGRPTESARELTVASVTHPDDIEETRARLAQAAEAGGSFEIENAMSVRAARRSGR
ncbi:GAF domain-containing protein [Chenggangzhangella methanolivorans]|uniref:PAS domain S-box protein n=1 Tax=Chenggangzhangella methanolivorans TaxID=1437009 RepID=A0A9E6RDR5_9HYPH|nr:GAF domain-containing protein [Chenggangzhangella methanolivorans]QZO01483.1 PAS domain S-box protein [Chenggangzhangella methanolivorans]